MNNLGKIVFYCLWPFIWLYAPLTRRVRVVVIAQGKVLVVKNWLGSGKWQLPGGGIRMRESVIAAAVREIEEELHATVTNTSELDDGPEVVRQNGLLLRYHFIRGSVKVSGKLHGRNGVLEARWIPIESLVNCENEVFIGIKKVTKLENIHADNQHAA